MGTLHIEEWPLPLARAYRNFQDSTEKKEAHDRACMFFEVLLKYITTIFLSHYVSGSDRDHRVNSSLKGLARPSLGEWLGFLRELLRYHRETERGSGTHLSELTSILRSRQRRPELCRVQTVLIELIENRATRPTTISVMNLFELLVRYRNWIAHGATPPREVYEKVLDALEGAFPSLLESLVFLTRLKLLVVSAMTGNGLQAVAAMGPAGGSAGEGDLDLSSLRLSGSAGSQLYIHTPSGEFQPCHPVLIYSEEDVYFLNSGLDDRRLRVEYLSYSTGRRQVPPDMVSEQRRLLGVILGYDVSEDEYTRISQGIDGFDPENDPEREKRKVIGDYIVLRELGHGGMGIVYEAHQRSLGRKVALKVLAATDASPKEIERFQRESRATARLHHPNIIPVFEVGEADGTFFLAMELVEGPNLAEFLAQEAARNSGQTARRSVPSTAGGLPDAATWARRFRDVARALDYAHEQGVIHRDIKPSNFMLDASGRLILLDFGLARDETEATMTLSQEQLGTPRYMSPEQVRGQRVDARTDLWSLGATLYEVLTLRPVFEGVTNAQIFDAITTRQPASPRKLNRHLPHDIEVILEKTLEKSRERRYSSASEIAVDLDCFLNYRPLRHARPVGAARRLAKLAYRHKVVSVAAAVALVALTIFLSTYFYGRVRQYAQLSARFDRAEEAENVPEAERALEQLREEYPDSDAIGGLDRRLAALREIVDRRLTRDLYADARRSATAYEDLTAEIGRLEAEWEEARKPDRPPPLWFPIWARPEEMAAWERLRRAREEFQSYYSQAEIQFGRAREIAPPNTPEHDLVHRGSADFYLQRLESSQRTGFVKLPPEYYEKLLGTLELGEEQRERLAGNGIVSLGSDPPGAAVHCFRYELHDECLLPLPWDPRQGRTLRAPWLEVEWTGKPGPFRTGDRLLEVKGEKVALRRDLARALAGVPRDASVPVKLLRDGQEVTTDWIPFPGEKYEEPIDEAGRIQPGEVLSIRDQLDLRFSGYPLDFHPDCQIGVTGASAPLELKLPRGSYLFVFRLDGYRDTRYPVAFPELGRRVETTVRLLREEEIPPDCVYIPEGEFLWGGDRAAFQSMEYGKKHLPGFFMRRLEVSVGEFLEFVNDREVIERTDHEPTVGGKVNPRYGWARPSAELDPEMVAYIDGHRALQGQFRLIPRNNKKRSLFFSWDGDAGRWRSGLDPGWPILEVSFFAAVEYALWYTRKSGNRWTYRLPSDFEWEKAARGVDRRIRVWGDYLVWSYCWSLSGNFRRLPATVGISPLDESVYGVRDLAGSVSELTTGFPVEGIPTFRSYRGGNWNRVDDYYFRIATRNGRNPEGSSSDTGFRLVADLLPREGAEEQGGD